MEKGEDALIKSLLYQGHENSNIVAQGQMDQTQIIFTVNPFTNIPCLHDLEREGLTVYQTTNFRLFLTLSQTSPGFYESAGQVF